MKGELFDFRRIPTQEILFSYLAIIALIAVEKIFKLLSKF